MTEAIRRRPYAVILFDEIEKAHRDVFNAFLQILDDGRLTDGQGRIVNFKNTIIIMTSNIGTELIMEIDDKKEIEKIIHSALKENFRPEFLNRIDEVVIFNRLKKEDVGRIIDIQLRYLQNRLAPKNITLTLKPAARERLAELGYDPIYGARPLKRAIQKYIQDPLALKILQAEVKEHDSLDVDVDKKTDEFKFIKII